jgi:deoxyadenosine/deoxycytidine kinase
MDRSLFSSGIFIDLSYMSPSQRTVARRMNEPYYKLPHLPPDLIMHLQTNPAACLERIQKMQRPSGNKIDLEYLETLDTRMTDWMTNNYVLLHRTRGSSYCCRNHLLLRK